MSLVKSHNRWLILLSFILALLCMVFPLFDAWQWWRPEFLALLVIYWVMMLPQQLSMLLIWCVGCLQDLLAGVALGQHALSLLVVAYVCLLSYQRIRNYVIWKQSFFIFVIIGLHQLIGNWVHSLYGGGAKSLIFLLPALTTAFIWPLAWIFLESMRRKFRVS